MPVPTPVPMRAPMPTPTPARTTRHTTAPAAAASHAPARTRRANPGDRLTVDPDDRRRRAQTALLELAVTRTVARRRTI